MTAETLIDLRDIRLTYPGASSPALDGVTLQIHAGSHTCILGGNGSGKSSLIQIMNALLVPQEGRARILGLDTSDPNQALQVRRQVSMVFQHPEDQMVTSIVADDVAFGPENLGVARAQMLPRVDAALAAVSMSDRAQADPADLSGGQKQRVAIAGALAMEPRILLLDEPAAMLDDAGRHAISNTVQDLKRRGITIVHVTHFMDEALAADRIIILDRGRIALDGTPQDVFAHREELLGLGLELPFAARLSERLRAMGFNASDTDTQVLARKLAEELRPWTSSPGVPAAAPNPGAHAPAPAPQAADTDRTAAIAFRDVSFSHALARSPRKRLSPWRARKQSKSAAHTPHALQHADFSVPAGRITALVGHTGSGKSTSVELACALKLPTAGTVMVGDIDTADLARRRELRRRIGYVSQMPEHQLFAPSVYEDVAFGPRNLGLSETEVERRVKEALIACGIDPAPQMLQRSPFALSGGQQRNVALAGVLAMGQDILVLDEPMAGLDPQGRARLRNLLRTLRDQGKTLLVVTHDMDDVAQLADHVIALRHGQVIAQGTPQDLFLGDSEDAPRLARELGAPAALAFARELGACGMPLARMPLTLDELCEEVVRYGAAR